MVTMPTIEEILEKPMDVKIQPEEVKPSKPKGNFWADKGKG